MRKELKSFSLHHERRHLRRNPPKIRQFHLLSNDYLVSVCLLVLVVDMFQHCVCYIFPIFATPSKDLPSGDRQPIRGPEILLQIDNRIVDVVWPWIGIAKPVEPSAECICPWSRINYDPASLTTILVYNDILLDGISYKTGLDVTSHQELGGIIEPVCPQPNAAVRRKGMGGRACGFMEGSMNGRLRVVHEEINIMS